MKLYPRKPRLIVFERAERVEIGMELLRSKIRAEKKRLREEEITPDMAYSDLSFHQRDVCEGVNFRLIDTCKELLAYVQQNKEVQSE